MTSGYSGDYPVDPHLTGEVGYSGYSGPPPTAPPSPPPTAPLPHGFGVPVGSYPAPGYGYPFGYPPVQGSYPMQTAWAPARPGLVLAASVLGYVAAGLLIFAGVLLFVGASVISSWDGRYVSTGPETSELVLDGILNMVAAGLLIAGAVVMTSGRMSGRVMLTVGAGICVAEGIYWLIRDTTASTSIWVFVFVALAVIALALAWTPSVTRWLRAFAA